MPYNDVAQNVLGTMGTVIWSGQVLPQIWKSFREKSTEGLSHWLMLIWSFSSIFLGTYNVVLNINIPLIIQPQLFGLLSTISWIQCLYYGQGLSKRLCALILLVYLSFFGGFQAGMVFVTRNALQAGNSKPIEFFGIFSGVMITVGLLPQIYEIYRLREVKGISMIFMCLDISGGVLSTLSLVFKEQFDGIAATTYLCVVFLDSCIVLAAIILNPRAKRRRAALQEQEAMEDKPSGGVSTNDGLAGPELGLSNDESSPTSEVKAESTAVGLVPVCQP